MSATKKRRLPDGWMGLHSRRWLKAQAQSHTRIIEVGSWLGRSTKVLAKHTKGVVYAVDHWQGTPDDPEQHALYAGLIAEGRDPYMEFMNNLRREIAAKRVHPIRMPSVEAGQRLLAAHGPASFDMVFIDADHGYAGCKGDIAAYLPLIAPGGLVSGHDSHWPGVARAVTEAFGNRVTYGPRSIWSVVV